MGTFYDEWLRYWDDEQEERAGARKSIHEEELEWVRTKQDHRAALLCSRQNGFVTAGNVLLGEIPNGWHTGKHSHGEEAIYIVDGKGFSVIDGKRYDWETGSCLFVPFGAVHQHFNSGDATVRYLSAMGLGLERFAGLARVAQYDEAGETPFGEMEGVEPAESEVHPEYGRIVLRAKDTEETSGSEHVSRVVASTDEFHFTIAKEMRNASNPAHHAHAVILMDAETGFKAKEVMMTAVYSDEPGKKTGKHSHMEAVLYVLQGEGHTIMDGETLQWKKGSLLQIPGPQTVHQHFVTGQVESRYVRIHFGLRSHFFQAIAKRVFPYQYFGFSAYGRGD